MEAMSAARPLFHHRKRKSARDLAMSQTCRNRLWAIAPNSAATSINSL